MQRIVILEDDETLGPLLQASLSEAGYSVSWHMTATEALAQIEEHGADLVIADILIVKDGEFSADGGIRLTSRLKQVMNHPAPVIAISGTFSSMNKVEAASTVKTTGAAATLAKPFEPSELLKMVRNLLARK